MVAPPPSPQKRHCLTSPRTMPARTRHHLARRPLLISPPPTLTAPSSCPSIASPHPPPHVCPSLRARSPSASMLSCVVQKTSDRCLPRRRPPPQSPHLMPAYTARRERTLPHLPPLPTLVGLRSLCHAPPTPSRSRRQHVRLGTALSRHLNLTMMRTASVREQGPRP